MKTPALRTIASGPAPPRDARRRWPPRQSLGQILLESGHLSATDLARATMSLAREETRLGHVLVTHGMITEAELYAALARQFGTAPADLAAEPPDTRLIDRLGVDDCLRHGLLPWKRVGAAVVVATSRPERFHEARRLLQARFGRVMMAVATEAELQAALVAGRQKWMARKAETRVAAPESCRDLCSRRARRLTFAGGAAVLAIAVALPVATLVLLTLWAALTLLASVGLKAAAAILQFRAVRRAGVAPSPAPSDPVIARLPTVSVLVPLFREREIAARLVSRLARLTYPKELLDICLVVEADDLVTRETLAEARLPTWMRQIIVPEGSLKTKPRALNFALDFCRGSIVGVYDAEDAPAPDQIEQVVRRFHQRGPEVACLQGVLDFYNARRNWLARCFAVEYASWFRIILPGLVRMGLVIPLGGTTLFFRRDALERLGGWDAHNVTEDADLGIRLARHGYRTELVETVTEEEADCRPWPWVKQRSRWLKGYAITWAVHMRNPRRLWRDLGAWRFFGVQMLFLGTISQFLLAPLLWSFWLLVFGLPHPAAAALPAGLLVAMSGLFVLAELVTLAVGALAVSGRAHRHLIPWVPTLHVYFPLAALACYKGVLEVLTCPFYWDKTAHGISDEDPAAPELPEPGAIPPPRSLRRRA